MNDSEPAAVYVVTKPEQIKAFTDPLRARVLRMLAARAMTNQQLADAFGEPHAKVLYHVRFLLDAGMIKLVDTQIKGGNVEKYYRAIARKFDIRPPEDDEATGYEIVTSYLENLRRDLFESIGRFPNERAYAHAFAARLDPQRAEDFNQRLLNLVAEYWPVGGEYDSTTKPRFKLNVQLYRDAQDEQDESSQT